MTLDRFGSILIALVLSGCFGSADDAPSTTAASAGTIPNERPSACTVEVNKGPWVVAISGSSAKLRWESCIEAPGTITLTPELGGTAHTATAKVTRSVTTDEFVTIGGGTDYAGLWFDNEVALTGLLPSTCYIYVVDRELTANGRFCTARRPGDAFTFAAIGDTNPGLGDNTSKILAQVYGGAYPIDFTVHVGDIQYYAGVDVDSYQYWFWHMAPLLRQGAFLPVIGNHEHELAHEMQEMVLRFWGGAGFDGTDTYYHYESGGVHFFVLDTEGDFSSLASPQIQWLIAKLEEASKQPGFRFSIVSQHRPMLTCGDHDDHPAERQMLATAFADFRVLLVLVGHTHGYERFELDGVTYVTTGGGGAMLTNIDQNLARPYCGARKVAGAFSHAMVFNVDSKGIRGRAVDRDGVLRDDFSIAVP